ncbi:C-CAP/cofactor C-like domain-containing protein [Actinidia rufa]|uniref:C-CAP/cofactor C-like domain-containing protein n=1 Tax=Actinidia rufa TaxID=165716 RepID=A0A7J0F4K2_9ERIC|nr:C-CAP/cofactor C-like domain-containing protein [Actinidia rufa]
MTDCPEPSTLSTSSTLYIHPRREPFEHGLIPIPKLIFTDGAQTLGPLKDKLIQRSIQSPTRRVDSLAVSEILQISHDHARLVIDTLSTVLSSDSDSDPLAAAESSEVDSVGVDVCDLVLFLYIQSYKRLLPRTHKDSASVAGVWPSTSAFDGYLSALSPLQLVRSNSRRFMPSQTDEEAHQLSYLQKHLANILSLLADSLEGEDEESLLLTMEKFDHLEFLIYFGEKGSERIPLSQAAPFFANSDPDMPAAPVPATQVLDWLLQSITSALENIPERASTKENGLSSASDQNAPMGDDCGSSMKASTTARGPCFIDGISKSSYLKQASDLHGSSV